ncbi:FeoA domain protein [Andreesenia angusta]|uniref:FeoA domain protein n=1 Tax=Andreesenia angusta TaxID=39480 RepID=A0A1S1V645_9FIRM|nr:FeoA family protein [Andreesenia angusta]OHW61994.1 FeoA domain protein [Andreesenia angusta]
MSLLNLKLGHTGVVKSVSGDPKTKKFLFTLGCSEGEEITLVSVLAGNYIVGIKDSRYAIDKKMAGTIELE